MSTLQDVDGTSYPCVLALPWGFSVVGNAPLPPQDDIVGVAQVFAVVDWVMDGKVVEGNGWVDGASMTEDEWNTLQQNLREVCDV